MDNEEVVQPAQQEVQEQPLANQQQVVHPSQPDQEHNPDAQQDSPQKSAGHSPSYSESQSSQKSEVSEENADKIVEEGTEKTRYKYCCKICKHTDKGKKACVCVVPLSQRRTLLGDQGCQTCKCHGCSVEDFVNRGEDPIYKITKVQVQAKKEQAFDGKNGCCRKCMKAFTKNSKACLCQVPENVRKSRIPAGGCKICGCEGCNPQDHRPMPAQQRWRQSRSRSRQRRRRPRSVSRSESFQPDIDISQMNFNNFDRSVLGSMIVNEFRVLPAFMGFGIPQRTRSYILNKRP